VYNLGYTVSLLSTDGVPTLASTFYTNLRTSTIGAQSMEVLLLLEDLAAKVFRFTTAPNYSDDIENLRSASLEGIYNAQAVQQYSQGLNFICLPNHSLESY
jgi:hypothetical protein